MTTTANASTVATSIVSGAPEITAPVRLPNQTNSDLIFSWLATKLCLWMLKDPWADEFEKIVGPGLWIRLSYKLTGWERDRKLLARTDRRLLTVHRALVAPTDPSVRQEHFEKLKKLLEKHFFDSSNQVEKTETSS